MNTKIKSSLRLITAPENEPVTVAEASRHLRLNDSTLQAEEYPLVESLITSARQAIEGARGWLGRALITQTWELVLDEFPCDEIRIPLPPLQTIVSIKYDDVNGVEQTVSSANYIVDAYSEPARVVPISTFFWPATKDKINAVRVRFTAGYGDDPEDVPAPIRSGMLLMIGNLYENRYTVGIGGTVNEIPMVIDALLAPYRIWSFG